MNNEPPLPPERIAPQERRALMELGVKMLLSPRTELDDANGDRMFKLDAYDIPRDSTLARDYIEGIEIRYRQVEEEGWPAGSEMMMVHVRYGNARADGTESKVFFMTSSPEDEAPELRVISHEEDEPAAMVPTSHDAIELRSVLIATHDLV